MCQRCQAEATGLRSGKGPAFFSKYILGARACKHDSSCDCEECERYRDRNSYANTTGIFNWFS